MKHVKIKSDLPEEPHFAALIFSSVRIPGDTRSRTHPGHGYPAEDRAVVEYIAFDTREDVEEWIERLEKCRSSKVYRIIEVHPRQVATSVRVKMD